MFSTSPSAPDIARRSRRSAFGPFPDIAPTFYKARLLLGKLAMPQIVTFVLQPSSSPEISTCAKWRVEAFGDVLETSVEAEKKSLLAFASDQSAQIALVAKLDSVLAGICLLKHDGIKFDNLNF